MVFFPVVSFRTLTLNANEGTAWCKDKCSSVSGERTLEPHIFVGLLNHAGQRSLQYRPSGQFFNESKHHLRVHPGLEKQRSRFADYTVGPRDTYVVKHGTRM